MRYCYFQFNRNPAGGKYAEMSKDECFKVKDVPDRWFINFGNCVIECREEEYREYQRQVDCFYYTRKSGAGTKREIVSLHSISYNCTYEMSVFSVHTECSLEDEVIEHLYMVLPQTRLGAL